MKKILISLTILSSLSSAFTFDLWSSKITLNEAIKIAKTENIVLHKDGIVTTGKKFREVYLYLDRYPNNRVFRYHTKLLNEQATVYLYFTKKEKKLYNLKVRWGQKSKSFRSSLYNLLDKKYGQKEVLLPNNFGEFLFSKKRQWKEDKNNIIQVKSGLATIELLYVDIEETKKDKEFKEKVKIEKKEKALLKDANKF